MHLIRLSFIFLFCFGYFSASCLAGQVAAPLSLKASNNPHNLSTSGNGNKFYAESETSITDYPETRICIFCHTPHNAKAQTQLWNRNHIGWTSNWPRYSDLGSIQIDTIAAAKYGSSYGEYPNGATRFCLSCHDGVSAIGTTMTYGPYGIVMDSNQGRGDVIDTSAALSNQAEFGNLHPVSFVYDATVVAALGTSFQLPQDQDKARLDGENRMQCTTCHDPHGYTPSPPFWRNLTDDTSGIGTCNECHLAGTGTPYHF